MQKWMRAWTCERMNEMCETIIASESLPLRWLFVPSDRTSSNRQGLFMWRACMFFPLWRVVGYGPEVVRWVLLRPISLLRLLDSNFPGNPLWTWEFHPLILRFCLSQALWIQNLSTEIGRRHFDTSLLCAEMARLSTVRESTGRVCKASACRYTLITIRPTMKFDMWTCCPPPNYDAYTVAHAIGTTWFTPHAHVTLRAAFFTAVCPELDFDLGIWEPQSPERYPKIRLLKRDWQAEQLTFYWASWIFSSRWPERHREWGLGPEG